MPQPPPPPAHASVVLRFLSRVESLPGPLLWVIALLLFALFGWLDATTGSEYRVFALYLLPICLISWGRGSIEGTSAALFGVAIWLWANLDQSPARPTVVLWNALEALIGSLLVGFLVGRLRDTVRQLRRLASTDPLTGIANRRAFEAALVSEVNRTRRFHRPLSLIFLDIDNFKKVNDAMGHAAGDQVLQQVAAVLQRTCRRTDTCARLGGDEFAILLPETSAAGACELRTALRTALLDSLRAFPPAGVSIGIQSLDDSHGDFRDLLQAADAAMYLEKAAVRASP